MRVPTYNRQVKRNDAGGGQLFNASVSASAAAAPGKAMSQMGDLIAEIGIKKMQIQTQNQVDQAEAMMLQELSDIQQDALRSPDPVAAEQETKDKMNGLLKKYNSGLAVSGNNQPLLSGRNAKARFMSRGQELVSAQIIDFTKQNNTRIVEFDRGNLDTAIDKSVKTISNTSLDVAARGMAFSKLFDTTDGTIAVGKTRGTIDDEGFMTRVDTATEQIVRGTALSLFQGSDSATAVALQITNGESTDLVLNSALAQMDSDDKQKVLNSLFTLAEKIDTERREKSEAADIAADENNKSLFSKIINTDTSDEKALAEGIAMHKTLLENNWYEPTQRKNAEAVLGLKKTETNEDTKIETTRNAARVIGNAKSNNTLSAEMIESLAGELSNSDYKQAYKDLEQENSEGYQAAKALISSATKYSEFKDTNNALGDASDMMYQESLLALNEWMNTPKAEGGGQGGTYQQVFKKAREINKENAEEFKGMLKDALISYLTTTQSLGAKFEDLTIDVDNPAKSALEWAAGKEQDAVIVGLVRIIKSYQKQGIR
jgi:hypothetical protein